MKKVLIIGMGLSGRAAYRFVQARGDDPIGVDDNQDRVAQLVNEGFRVGIDIDLDWADLVVVSPGVPSSNRWVQAAVKSRKKIIGEAELALQEGLDQTAIAITGTNGKTTVTLLVEHILKEAGKKAVAVGNVGVPLTSYFITPNSEDILVVELSSYQLETLSVKSFDAGIVLNVTPDHLDRYASMEEYARAKFRLQQCLKEGAPFYVNSRTGKEFGSLIHGAYETFGSTSDACFWTDGAVIKHLDRVELTLPSELRIQGMHDSENLLAAWILCNRLGVDSETFLEAFQSFRKPRHRIEFVATLKGVHYYDDSKGTNIDATIQAVKAMQSSTILIVGGVDKGASYASWNSAFEGRVKTIFAIGAAAEKIVKELDSRFSIQICRDLDEAVQASAEVAVSGDCVLLSPGCSSFDMFRDYAHRGDVFQKAVRQLGAI